MAKAAHQPVIDAGAIARFDAEGWVALPGLLGPDDCHNTLEAVSRLVERARVEPGARDRVTGGTLHLDALHTSPEPLPEVWADERVLAVVRHHLGPEAVVADATYRAPLPGHGAQTLHADWPAPIYDAQWQVCNALIALVDINEQAGATRVVPGTHRTPDSRFRAKSPTDRHPRQVLLAGAAGTAFVFSGHLLHSGTVNGTDAPRHALLVNYRRGAGGAYSSR
jgi:hypothetical protein